MYEVCMKYLCTAYEFDVYTLIMHEIDMKCFKRHLNRESETIHKTSIAHGTVTPRNGLVNFW